VNKQNVLDTAFRLLLECGEQVMIGCEVSVKTQVLGTYLARLLRPVWQLNIVAVDAHGNTISNVDYFK